MFGAIYDILTDKLVIGFVIFMVILLILRSYVFKSDDEFSAGLILRLGIAYIAGTALIGVIYDGTDSDSDSSSGSIRSKKSRRSNTSIDELFH